MRAFDDDKALTCSFEHIVCYSALMSKELAERVRARMCPNLYYRYGSTEAGNVAFGPASSLLRITGAVGYVVPGATIEITDVAGQYLPAGREGTIRIRASSMARCYLADPGASAEAFREGFFYPGDLGYLMADGIVVLTGREKTILNLGGHKTRPEIIEDVL